ncbi:OX-2 membrane glycoprotein-like isoform X1 [Nerophis ophidion]|uniref:OX-2 membrane glycoprotein-like isoform X1 n=1 Tax=Nerophis ophidion TaxID=159077 RepID=UPI002ADF81AB|nr:OX-2 membrane glycoprotein-like isoform X1 [Nerophis ophidion]XP_061745648.1 OX-2 membrane glycoprotein-like isoform X1 [Nerophis ophidion]XP_061745649.1 OX-2 membrane glycoprotein-like isoform X1 [Nerophis ophidion]XP_061745650.1 OX-2 membrane glycoprotein-like isoform X1 [Nerophis ophidion]
MLGLRLTLLLWIGGTSSTQGEVISPPTIHAEAGTPVLLGCNVTTTTGDSIQQVRWLDKDRKLLLAYEERTAVRISHQLPNVRLTASHGDSSYITIARVLPEDEGCFRCIFDVFPRGSQEGSACIRVTARVHLDGNKTAVSGKPAVLSCWYDLPERVQQVLWKKTSQQGHAVTLASYAKQGHSSIEEALRTRLSLSGSLGAPQLNFQPVSIEDEACYTCEFNTYPDGTRSNTACLYVYVLPEAMVTHATSSSGDTEANCTVRSRPASNITWRIGEDNQTLESPLVSLSHETDGTTTLTSTLHLQSGVFTKRSVQCIVHHQGLDLPLAVSLNNLVNPVKVTLIWLGGVVAVLILLFLCVYLRVSSHK